MTLWLAWIDFINGDEGSRPRMRYDLRATAISDVDRYRKIGDSARLEGMLGGSARGFALEKCSSGNFPEGFALCLSTMANAKSRYTSTTRQC